MLNDIKEIPKCPLCGKLLMYHGLHNGYAKACKKCANKLESKHAKMKATLIERYGSVENGYKARQAAMKKTNLERYGCENSMQNEDIKNKSRQTNIERNGGVGFASKQTTEKYKKTCLERYGFEQPMQSEIVKQHVKDTLMDRYGVDCSFKTESAKEKTKNTLIAHYGTTNYHDTQEVKDKTKKTCQERYGVDYACQRPEARKASNNSKVNQKFAAKLDSFGIEYKREYTLDNYSFDFKIDNVLLELNPSCTHNCTFSAFGKEPLNKEYHIDKTKAAENAGYRCIHIWDWDNQEKIISSLLPKASIPFNECTIKEVALEECIDFLNKYDIYESIDDHKISFGIYNNNELVEILVFGNCNNKDYELLRMCSKFGIEVEDGTKALFDHFINMHTKKISIIAYCDRLKDNGKKLEELGFKLIGCEDISKHWYSYKLKRLEGRNCIADKDVTIDKINSMFGTSLKEGEAYDDVMIGKRFMEIYDCGRLVYEC